MDGYKLSDEEKAQISREAEDKHRNDKRHMQDKIDRLTKDVNDYHYQTEKLNEAQDNLRRDYHQVLASFDNIKMLMRKMEGYESDCGSLCSPIKRVVTVKSPEKNQKQAENELKMREEELKMRGEQLQKREEELHKREEELSKRESDFFHLLEMSSDIRKLIMKMYSLCNKRGESVILIKEPKKKSGQIKKGAAPKEAVLKARAAKARAAKADYLAAKGTSQEERR